MEAYEALGESAKNKIEDLEHPIICAFEAHPPDDWAKSFFLLSGIGCPIGEMFELTKLADDSAKGGVYTYFFTSAPLDKEDGVASPSNAMCIK